MVRQYDLSDGQVEICDVARATAYNEAHRSLAVNHFDEASSNRTIETPEHPHEEGPGGAE